MSKDKPKKPKSIDDLFKDMQDTHSRDLDAAFKANDEFKTEENLNHWYNNIFSPAHDEMYKAIKEELDKAFQNDDDAKTEKKKDEVKKAVTAGLKKYFEKSQPGILSRMKDLEIDEKQEYDFLTGMYDEHVGVGKIKGVDSIREIEQLAKGKRITVGHLKKQIHDSQGKYIEGALNIIVDRHTRHHLGKFEKTEIAAYLKPKLEKVGVEIDDTLGFGLSEVGDLMKWRETYLEKKGHPYFKKREEKGK